MNNIEKKINAKEEAREQSKFVETYYERIKKAFDDSQKNDDFDRIWSNAIKATKAQVIFETLHPESKKGRKTKEEGSDERFIGRNIDEIDGLIDDKYDDPELIIQAYRTIRQKKTINTSDVGKAMLTDPKVIEGRKAIARDEKNQRTDNSEKKPTDE